ncbi:hypothetical protein P7K49_028061 [Saguinus oedipus]|uniref:Uncharacterized protein n=1 Tax=Saguinus oedipus TaxID=9490 RepID=A0ABQ9UB72_SAGOE|nr:hypothetical protein P7K49_028061 [Saguinus oedipus]
MGGVTASGVEFDAKKKGKGEWSSVSPPHCFSITQAISCCRGHLNTGVTTGMVVFIKDIVLRIPSMFSGMFWKQSYSTSFLSSPQMLEYQT